MAVGQNSIKRASGSGPKTKTAAKAAAPVKAAAIPAPAAGTGKLYTDQEDGINAHYGVNTPLPTFLL